MLIHIAGIIFPVFAVIAIGYAYGRKSRPDIQVLNQVNMSIFVPALVFSALAAKSVDIAAVQIMALGGLCIVLGSGLLAWPLARWLGYDPKTFIPPTMFKNAGNMGLPLLLLAFGEQGLPAAVVLFLVENSLHFSIATCWLGRNARVWRIVAEPVILAGLAGLVVNLAGLALWPPVLSAVQMLGNVSTGLMLFCLGVRLNTAPFAHWRIGLAAGVATPVAGMLVAGAFCAIFNMPPLERGILLTFGALPPAVLNFMFAEKYGQEPEKVASIVIMGNLMALGFVSLALAVGLPG